MNSESVGTGCAVIPGINVPHIDWYSPAHQLDMDRCTLRTQDGVDALLDNAQTFNVDPGVVSFIRDEQSRIEADGGTFDPLQYLQDALQPENFDTFCDYFVKSDTDLAYADTQLLHSELRPADAHTAPHFFNTYGVSILWQALKLPKTNIPAWAILMPHSDKTGYASQLRNPDGTINMLGIDEHGKPEAVYHMHSGIESTDDKSKSLKNTHSGDRGNMLWRLDEKRLPSQGTEVPEGVRDRVRTIHSLGDVCVEQEMELAACSPTPLPDGPLQPAAFRPLSDTTGYPGLYIARTMPFSLIRRQIEAMQR
jgi:hypothetical protein